MAPRSHVPTGRIFAVPPANPFFDLEALVAESIHEQDRADALSTISISPLTSPESSPPSSPVPSPLQPPINLPPDPVASTSKTTGPSQPNQSNWKRKQPPEPKRPDRILPPTRKARRNASAYAARDRRREREQAVPEPSHHALSYAQEEYVDNVERVPCNIDIEELPIANGGYVALNDGSENRKTYTLQDLVGETSKLKFRLQTWDGSKPMALVDNKNRVIGVLAGHPRDDKWPELEREAAAALENMRSRCHVSKKEKKRAPRRGKFVALRCGVSHGGGQKRPGNLCNHPQNQKVLDELNKLEPFVRIAGFSSSVMATWAPDLHEYYKNTAKTLHTEYPELRRPFSCSVFCSCSYNLGPCTVCFKHKDRSNLAFGMCSVTSFGEFDYTTGGHLILWDLKLVVEFPPGCTILIPSAVIAHSNVAIGKDERRYSFAQYSAGGLFRWVENDCKPREEYLAGLSSEDLKADKKKQEGRLEHGLSLLLTLPPAPAV